MKANIESLPDKPEDTSTLNLFDHLIEPSSALSADKLPLEDIVNKVSAK